MRPFRFGVQGGARVSEPVWAEFVRRAEDHGYDVVSMADHFDGRPAPLVALAYAAALTDRVHLGTAVLGVDFRNPVVLAQELATLDELSRERLEVGLGAGWKADDYAATGIPFDPPAARIDRLARALVALRARLRPGLRIMAGGGGRRMLTVAAEHADIVSLVPANRGGRSNPWGDEASPVAFAAKTALVREAAGDRFDGIELHTRVFASLDDGERGNEVVRRLGAAGAAASPMVLVRPARAMADKLLRMRDEIGISYVTVSAPFVDEFAPVIDLLRDR